MPWQGLKRDSFTIPRILTGQSKLHWIVLYWIELAFYAQRLTKQKIRKFCRITLPLAQSATIMCYHMIWTLLESHRFSIDCVRSGRLAGVDFVLFGVCDKTESSWPKNQGQWMAFSLLQRIMYKVSKMLSSLLYYCCKILYCGTGLKFKFNCIVIYLIQFYNVQSM